jgi:hypothetical protein
MPKNLMYLVEPKNIGTIWVEYTPGTLFQRERFAIRLSRWGFQDTFFVAAEDTKPFKGCLDTLKKWINDGVAVLQN